MLDHITEEQYHAGFPKIAKKKAVKFENAILQGQKMVPNR